MTNAALEWLVRKLERLRMDEMVSAYDRVKLVVIEIRDLLANYPKDRQATAGRQYLDNTIAAFVGQAQHVPALLNSLEIWGGSGSIRDLNLESYPDSIRLRDLLVQLRNHMLLAGIASVPVATTPL